MKELKARMERLEKGVKYLQSWTDSNNHFQRMRSFRGLLQSKEIY